MDIGEQAILAVARWIGENPPNIDGLWIKQSKSSGALSEMAVLALFRALSSNQHVTVFQLRVNSCACDVAQLWDCLANNYTLEVVWLYNEENNEGENFRKICTRNLFYKNQQRFKSVKAVVEDQ